MTKRSDSFLVLDVNPSVAPWVWVKSRDLINAMRTRDSRENRGYVLVSDPLGPRQAPLRANHTPQPNAKTGALSASDRTPVRSQSLASSQAP